MTNEAAKSLNQLFLDNMDKKLKQYSSCFKKSSRLQFDEYQVTTYLHNDKSFIIDVVEEECCLTRKSGANIIYVFYSEDYEEIIDEIIDEIKQFLE